MLTSIYTFVKKRFGILAFFLVLTMVDIQPTFASSGAQHGQGGFFNTYFVHPLASMLTWMANHFGNNFGLAIIIMTIIVRVCLLPIMISQMKGSEKMRAVQPKMTAIREKYKDNKDPDMQMKMQKELMQVYQEHNINPLAMGCLPALIQLPILYSFYHAIMLIEPMAIQSFLWFNLGVPDPYKILPVLAGLTTFLQVRYSMSKQPMANNQMNIMSYVMAGMIMFTASSVPAALSLYWVIGGLFSLTQTVVFYQFRKTETETALDTPQS